MYQLLQTICTQYGWDYTPELEAAFECACLTEEEYKRDRTGCINRIYAALEEM